MALNDNAVITAAVGYVFTAAVGTAAPTPSELDTVDPERFGCQVLNLTLTGDPTAFTLKVGTGTASASIAADATPDQVLAAVEALTEVGAGNLIVEGENLDVDGYTIVVTGALAGTTLALNGTATGGSTPTVVVATVTAPNGWKNMGHTSRDDMPEFAFDGGDTSVLGTWQKKRLREVATGDPVADSVTVHLEQWDKDSLELYFGEDAASTPGVFGVSGDFVPVERAFLVIIVDGAARISFYAPKASIRRDDSIDLPVDGFASLPIKATFLNLGSRRLYDWISLDLLS